MQTTLCPKCQSTHIESRNLGRKAGSALGVFVGFAGTVAIVGAMESLPGGANIRRFATVLMKAMVGGTSGCAVGAALGEVIDENVLTNHRCLHCGHCFSFHHH